MIVFKNWPLGSVEDKDYRSFADMENFFATRTVRDVIIVLARIVSELLSLQMKKATRGAIMHDGWSNYTR